MVREWRFLIREIHDGETLQDVCPELKPPKSTNEFSNYQFTDYPKIFMGVDGKFYLYIWVTTEWDI